MSAIWGIVALRPDCSIPEHCAQLFESTYQNNCKIDRYESASATGALFGCGIQYITKESRQEQLPCSHPERGILFTADCILDNRTELIELLSSHGFTKEELINAPDGTLMYNAYLTFGNNCVTHLRGLFSFAVWEEKNRTLTLFSDHTAARSLYYTKQNGLLAFSTRMEPLLKLFPNSELNVNYFKDFLLANPSTIYVVPGETPYKEISLMLPSTHICIRESDIKTVAYWSPEHSDHSRKKSTQAYRTQFLRLYQKCVNDALRTSGEVGIAMSSGLDSSSVGVLAAKALEKEGKTLHSYTFTPFLKQAKKTRSRNLYDESEPVLQIKKMYPNIRTTFLNNDGKNLFADMSLCCNLLEFPYKTAAFPNQYEMCYKGADSGCKVFLNGAFGNHTVSFGHIQNALYHLYRNKKFLSFFILSNRYAKHEHLGRKKFLTDNLKNFRSFDKCRKTALSDFVPSNFFLSRSIWNDYNFTKRFSVDTSAVLPGEYHTEDSYRRYLFSTNLLIYLGVFETQFGLCTGMLLRDPTKDVRILEFCYALPFRMFFHQGIPRWLIRGPFETLLPDAVLKPWEQRGLLNADWIQRIRRDWNTLKPELLQHLSSEALDDYIEKGSVLSFIESFGNNLPQETNALIHLCAIEGLVRFLSLQHKT